MTSPARHLVVATASAVMLLPAAATAATAATSYNGSDYSTDYNAGHQIRTAGY